MAWTKDELRGITEGDDLHVAPFREDGITHGTPTWIWSVAVDGALYVRAYPGPKSRWYRAALRQRAGRISAAGTTRMSPSCLSKGRSTISSTTPTGQSTVAARTLAR